MIPNLHQYDRNLYYSKITSYIIIIIFSTYQYSRFGNCFLNLFFLGISNFYNLIIFTYVWKIVLFLINRIERCLFFVFKMRITFLLLFSKKESISKRIVSKLTFFLSMILKIIITVFMTYIMSDLEKQNDLKQPGKVINSIIKVYNYSSIMPILWLNTNGYIWCLGLGCEIESIHQGRSYINTIINISNCFFSRYSLYSGNGGVICVDGSSYSMNVNYSMFYNCACSNHGGAIYFFSSNSNLRMVCANRCSCGNSSVCNGHFAIVSASQKNQVEYLSVSKCTYTSSGYCSIYLQIGNQRADNTNSSMNNVIQYSGFRTWLPSSFTSIYCTFSNNNASEFVCMNFYSTSGTISMSYANIVHNNSPSGYGIINVNGEGLRMMMYCIFKNNQNFLFCVLAGSLEVSHSFIDHSSSFCLTNFVSTVTNNSFINRLTYQIQFFHSHHCNADLAINNRTPMITFEKSPMRFFEEKILIMVMLICF